MCKSKNDEHLRLAVVALAAAREPFGNLLRRVFTHDLDGSILREQIDVDIKILEVEGEEGGPRRHAWKMLMLMLKERTFSTRSTEYGMYVLYSIRGRSLKSELPINHRRAFVK